MPILRGEMAIDKQLRQADLCQRGQEERGEQNPHQICPTHWAVICMSSGSLYAETRVSLRVWHFILIFEFVAAAVEGSGTALASQPTNQQASMASKDGAQPAAAGGQPNTTV